MSEHRSPLALQRGRHTALWRGLALPCVLGLGWTAYTHVGGHMGPLSIPLEKVLAAPFFDADGRNLWLALLASVLRLIAGFSIGALAGLGCGLLLGTSRLAWATIDPSFNALRQIALFAWIPLLTAWLGNGDTVKVVFIALSAFFPVALNTQSGLRNIAVQHLEVARVLRLSPRRRLTKLHLPGALPAIGLGLQIGLISAWLGTVTAEYAIGGSRGLGGFIAGGREQFRMDIVLVGVIALTLVGAGMNAACSRLLALLAPYRGKST